MNGVGFVASVESSFMESDTFSFNRASLTGFCGVDFGTGAAARESLESAIVKKER